jgi:hypothetical protein
VEVSPRKSFIQSKAFEAQLLDRSKRHFYPKPTIMKRPLQKLYLALLLTEYKLVAFAGNQKAQQTSLEKLVLFRTQMRVEQEQDANKLLFGNL